MPRPGNRICKYCEKKCFGHLCIDCYHKGKGNNPSRRRIRRRYNEKQKEGEMKICLNIVTHEDDPSKFMTVQHKCGRMWRMSKNVGSLLYCPHCKTKKGFKELKK